jgi:hypothetical protein
MTVSFVATPMPSRGGDALTRVAASYDTQPASSVDASTLASTEPSRFPLSVESGATEESEALLDGTAVADGTAVVDADGMTVGASVPASGVRFRRAHEPL